MSVPDEKEQLVRCMKSEFYNGFGFECDDNGNVIFAKVCKRNSSGEIDESKMQQRYADLTNSKTFRVIEPIGRHFVSVHHSEWHLIPDLFAKLLEQYVLVTHNRLEVVYDSSSPKFDWKDMEFRFMHQFYARVKNFGGRYETLSAQIRDYMYFCWKQKQHVITSHWNFTTPEGKFFCSRIRRILGKPPVSKKLSLGSGKTIRWKWHDDRAYHLFRKYQVYFFGTWSQYVPSGKTVNDVIFHSDEIMESEELELCYICYDATPNTIVEPCGHMCVCKECSDKLAHTNDAKTCVRCRREIEQIVVVQ